MNLIGHLGANVSEIWVKATTFLLKENVIWAILRRRSRRRKNYHNGQSRNSTYASIIACLHYDDVTVTTLASQITSLTVVYSFNRLFRRRSRKTSKLRVTGLCAGNSPGPVNSPHKGPVTRKMFPFDDVIMICNCRSQYMKKHTVAEEFNDFFI